MLYEIKDVKQRDKRFTKRWFFDRCLDLYIWLDVEEEIEGFQLIYDKQSKARAVTWFRDKGFAHCKIDDDDRNVSRRRGSRLLVSDGFFDGDRVAKEFKEKSADMNKRISAFVYNKIVESGNREFVDSEKRKTNGGR